MAECDVLEEAANEKNNCGKDHSINNYSAYFICYYDCKHTKLKKGEK